MRLTSISDRMESISEAHCEAVAKIAVKNKALGALCGFGVVLADSLLMTIAAPFVLIETVVSTILNLIGSQHEKRNLIPEAKRKFTMTDAKKDVADLHYRILLCIPPIAFLTGLVAHAILIRQKTRQLASQ